MHCYTTVTLQLIMIYSILRSWWIIIRTNEYMHRKMIYQKPTSCPASRCFQCWTFRRDNLCGDIGRTLMYTNFSWKSMFQFDTDIIVGVVYTRPWWRHQIETFPRYWPFVRGTHRSPVNCPHKGQWREALMFSLICAWMNSWVNNREAGDLRHHRTHYDVTTIHCYEDLATQRFRELKQLLWDWIGKDTKIKK